MEDHMRRFAAFFCVLAVVVPFVSGDTVVTDYFELPGQWSILRPGDSGFRRSPTEDRQIVPLAHIVRDDNRYFGYVFAYDPGAMSGTGSPMMGDFEYFPEWSEFGWTGLQEADFRALLDLYGTDPRRQHFWHMESGMGFFGGLVATGFAHFDNTRYGFAAVAREADVAWYMAAFIFCDAESFDESLDEMKKILNMP
jgi:hypothetical protein